MTAHSYAMTTVVTCAHYVVIVLLILIPTTNINFWPTQIKKSNCKQLAYTCHE